MHPANANPYRTILFFFCLTKSVAYLVAAFILACFSLSMVPYFIIASVAMVIWTSILATSESVSLSELSHVMSYFIAKKPSVLPTTDSQNEKND